MNREIKFRAWEDNKMINDITVGCIVSEGGRFSDEQLMQYTGLKDKNGKEIYDGDIVESYSHCDPRFYQIEFLEGGFCATHPRLEGYPIDINHFFPSIGCCIEVVGNIYESPELLK